MSEELQKNDEYQHKVDLTDLCVVDAGKIISQYCGIDFESSIGRILSYAKNGKITLSAEMSSTTVIELVDIDRNNNLKRVRLEYTGAVGFYALDANILEFSTFSRSVFNPENTNTRVLAYNASAQKDIIADLHILIDHVYLSYEDVEKIKNSIKNTQSNHKTFEELQEEIDQLKLEYDSQIKKLKYKLESINNPPYLDSSNEKEYCPELAVAIEAIQFANTYTANTHFSRSDKIKKYLTVNFEPIKGAGSLAKLEDRIIGVTGIGTSMKKYKRKQN